MFSYLGGKKFQAKWIASQFPKHNTYVEPFGGAYWVYFMANHQIDQAHTNVYNDFNKDIANIFHCARYKDREFLKSLLSYEPQKEEIFNQFKSDLIPFNTDFELGDIDRATKYIYLQTQSFSGDTLNEKTKFVNLFGEQRLSENNPAIGKALVKKDFKQAVALILSTKSEASQEIHKSMLSEPKNYIAALKKLPIKLIATQINHLHKLV